MSKSQIRAVVACGANLGEREQHLARAQEKISALKDVRLIAVSKFYETKPVGLENQPDFLNGAFLIETRLSYRELFARLLEIEKSEGRVREIPGGPRTLDLDLIFYGSEIIKEKDLVIPHPRMHERGFVLRPVADIAPEWIHPVFKKTVKQLLAGT